MRKLLAILLVAMCIVGTCTACGESTDSGLFGEFNDAFGL